ncbi:MAG: hypothetical protein R6W72_07005 [Desulfurivibrionaceae bacterium]
MSCNKEKISTEIVERAKWAAEAVPGLVVEGETSVGNWLLANQGDLGDWPLFATIACAFLALEGQGACRGDGDFRELTAAVKDRLGQWDERAPQPFYELADFVITSEGNGVDFVSATGLWVVWKVMEDTPTPDNVKRGYRVGHLFNAALVGSC